MDRRKQYPRKTLKMTLLMLASIAICVIPAYYVTTGFFRVAGIKFPLLSNIVVAIIGVLLFFFTFRAVGALLHRSRGRFEHDHFPKVMNDTLEALDDIARGDFDVLVETDEHGHYQELVERVNKMARELRSMEHLRQDFVSNVSHEIQSPLTSISGYAELLQQEDLPSELRRHYAEIIEVESRRLSKLSDNLLRLSVLDAEQAPRPFAPFRLDKQLEEVLLVLEPQWAAKGLSPDVSLEKITVTADQDLLQQVWMNLLHNSIKFTPDGGTLTVTLREEPDAVHCTIADDGIGIPEEALIRIFERFYKVDKARDRSLGGNGLGLSLAKKIIDLHGGTIAVQSAPGEGTAFTVTLPKEQAEAS